ncbi:MAG: UDP-N-acetylmuramoyl-L-alanine--D-glutamate ligase, partial [Bacteroidia bacterium]
MPKAKSIFILGAGESGVGAALLAQAKGYRVTVANDGPIANTFSKELQHNGITYFEFVPEPKTVLPFNEFIKSPG